MTTAPANPFYPHLFSAFELCGLTIPNRVVMAPMSTQLANADGTVSARQIAFYRERAFGGTGMIVVEFCCVHAATGRSEHSQLVLETEAHAASHVPLVQMIRAAGAVACLQLQHGGPGVKRSLVEGGVAVGPSDVVSRREPGKLTCRAMTDEGIEALIERFGHAAELGVGAGYQAVELHGAHGYLLTTFLSPMTNRRNDAWGGDEERRLRFPCRVIERVKRAIGNRPLIYRLSADEFSPAGLSIEDMERITPRLVAAGADAIHVSIGHGSTSFDKIIEPMSMPEGWRLPYARRIRAATRVPVISVGQIRWPDTAERAIRDGDADFIALGRTLLADPEWANKAKRGEADRIRPCTSCNYCIAPREDGAIRCAENPRTGHELDAAPDAAGRKGKLAVVIGAGPGGIAAALMLDQAGYRTQLHEARPALGGGLVASAAPPYKDKLGWYQTYLERRLTGSNVAVLLSSRLDSRALIAASPDIVIVAIGGQANVLDIRGLDRPFVYDAYEVLMGDDRWLPFTSEPSTVNRQPSTAASGRSTPVLIYGGGETGCEAAEYVAARGFDVLLVTRSSRRELARSAEMIYRGVLLQRLDGNSRIRILDRTHLTAIEDHAAVLTGADETQSIVQVSRVLIAQGRHPDPRLARELEAAGIRHAVIGDARRGGRIGDAVQDAYDAVMRVSQLAPAKSAAWQLAC